MRDGSLTYRLQSYGFDSLHHRYIPQCLVSYLFISFSCYAHKGLQQGHLYGVGVHVCSHHYSPYTTSLLLPSRVTNFTNPAILSGE